MSLLLWGIAALIQMIFVLQKWAARAINKLGQRDVLRERFKDHDTQ